MVEQGLIYADKLKQYIDSVSNGWLDELDTLGVLNAIDKQPTVDAAPIVRCKDCVLSMPAYSKGKISETEIYCPFLEIRRPKDWYCADGDRKDSDSDAYRKRKTS